MKILFDAVNTAILLVGLPVSAIAIGGSLTAVMLILTVPMDVLKASDIR